MREVIYIDKDERKVSPQSFLSSYEEKGHDISRLFRRIEKMDYVGSIHMKTDLFNKSLQCLKTRARSFLEQTATVFGNRVSLRGREYYLDVACNNNIEQVRSKIIDNLPVLEDILAEERSNIVTSEEDKIALASVFDHRKHYALCMLIATYCAMLKDSRFGMTEFELMKSYCESAIADYYAFVISDKMQLPNNNALSCVDLFKQLPLPEDTTSSEGVVSEKGARKLVFREMDHPGEIILFSGQLLKYDGSGKIDVLLNPLAGGAEIGFALKSIYHTFGIEKIDQIHLIRYSRYGELHKKIDIDGLSRFVPQCMIPEFVKLNNKRIYVVDDNAFSGESLNNLKELMRRYSSDVHVAVIERPIDLPKNRPPHQFVTPDKLDVPVIAKWRSVKVMEEVILENLNMIT